MPEAAKKHEYPKDYAKNLHKQDAKKNSPQKNVPAPEEEWDLVKPADLKPFVDWSKTPEIEGLVSNFRILEGEYGVQDVIDVGEYSVGITTALRALTNLSGAYVKITYEGMEESSKGRQFKNFTILRRKDKPAA